MNPQENSKSSSNKTNSLETTTETQENVQTDKENTSLETQEEPSTRKKGFPLKKLLLISFTFLILLATAILAYLYITKRENYDSLLFGKLNLEDEKRNLEQENDTLRQEKKDLEEEIVTLEEQNTTLEAEVEDYKAKQAQIKAYNDFDEYVFYVVGIHGGFINLTEAEYQTARTKAEATGDQDLVAAVDSAWNDTHISQIIRFVNVMNEVIGGIDENCN